MHTHFLLHNKRACVWCQLSPIRFGRSWLTAPAGDMPLGTGSIRTTHKLFCRNMQLRHDHRCISIAKKKRESPLRRVQRVICFSRHRLPADSFRQSTICLMKPAPLRPRKILASMDIDHFRFAPLSLDYCIASTDRRLAPLNFANGSASIQQLSQLVLDEFSRQNALLAR